MRGAGGTREGRNESPVADDHALIREAMRGVIVECSVMHYAAQESRTHHLIQHRRLRGVLSDRDAPETSLAKHVVAVIAAKAPSDRKIADTPLLRLVPVVSAADL